MAEQVLNRLSMLHWPARLGWRSLTPLLVTVGVGLRAWQAATDRSLLLDEAMLALNVVERGFAGLVGPLDFDQSAPLGFLWAQKSLVLLLGNYDLVHRLIPLLAGCLALVLMARLGRWLLGPIGALAALGLFAVGDRLVYYASEAKPYSTDVLVTLALLLVALDALDPARYPLWPGRDPNSRWLKPPWPLLVVGSAALWLAYPAVFVLAGVGLALLTGDMGRRAWREVRVMWAVGLGWGLNLLVLYALTLRASQTNAFLLEFWRDWFMPMPPWADPAWLARALADMLRDPAGLALAPLSGALVLIGAAALGLTRRREALLLLVPFAATLLASGLRLYPFGLRLLLFLTPLIYILVGAGVERVVDGLRRLRPALGVVSLTLLVGLLFYAPVRLAVAEVHQPFMGEHMKPLLAYVQAHGAATDTVYVFYGAEPAFRYYAPFYGLTDNPTHWGKKWRDEPTQYRRELDALRGAGRVWIVFSHFCTWCALDEEHYFLDYIDTLGTQLDQRRAPGAALYLYDLR